MLMRQNASKTTCVSVIVGWISDLRRKVHEGRHGQPRTAKCSQCTGASPNEDVEQSLLQLEKETALGTSGHETEQAWYTETGCDLHRSFTSSPQRRRRSSSRDYQILVTGSGKYIYSRRNLIKHEYGFSFFRSCASKITKCQLNFMNCWLILMKIWKAGKAYKNSRTCTLISNVL